MLTIMAKRSVAASESGNVPWPSSTGFIVAMAKLNAGQLVGFLADRDGPVLQALEERALGLERDAVDFVEQDDFGRGQRPELGDQLAGRRVDHLKADDFGRLQVGPALDPGELGVADGGENHAEEGLADARNAPQEQVAGVHLPVLLLVVGRRNFREQDDVGEGFCRVVADKGLAALGNDGFMKVDGLLEIRVHVAPMVTGSELPAKRERGGLPGKLVAKFHAAPGGSTALWGTGEKA